MTELLVSRRTVYGSELIYPANEAAQALAEIAGTTTLSERALGLAEKLGCTVAEISATHWQLIRARRTFAQNPTPALSTVIRQLERAVARERTA